MRGLGPDSIFRSECGTMARTPQREPSPNLKVTEPRFRNGVYVMNTFGPLARLLNRSLDNSSDRVLHSCASPPSRREKPHSLSKLLGLHFRTLSFCLVCAFSAVLMLFLAGCTKSHQIELWNNSGQRVTLVASGETNAVPPAGTVRIGWPRAGDEIIFNVGGKTLVIRFTFPPSSFLLETTTATTFRMQIEAGGVIYVLDPWTKGVQLPPPQQPPGFPLRPVVQP